MNKKYFLLIVILASIGISTLVQSGLDTFNIWHLLGRATGLIIFPGIAALIISGVTGLFQRKLSEPEFRNIFGILWVFGLLLLLAPFFLINT